MLKRWLSNQKLEYWKTIEDYSNYMVSSLGRVKSLERKVKHRNSFITKKEKILKPGVDGGGYLQVVLYKNGKAKAFKVHRLVANTFIPNPLNKETVNHKNEIKADNRVINLEWMTTEENNNYGTRNKRAGKAQQGEKNPMARKVKCVETGEIFDCIKFACEWCHGNVYGCIGNEGKSAGKHPITGQKLTWMYVD